MNRAFLFDMDGVIVDSERTWTHYDDTFLYNLFGKEIYQKFLEVEAVGLSIPGIYDEAVKLGFKMPREEFYSNWHKQAQVVYSETPISLGFLELVSWLKLQHFKIGIVSAAPSKK